MRYWVTNRAGGVDGPFEVSTIQAMLKAKEINSSTQLCEEDSENWLALSQVSEIQSDGMKPKMTTQRTTYLKALFIMGLIEGTSTLVLFFIAMPLKYRWDVPEAVSIVGSVHGLLFVVLVLMFLYGRWTVPLSWGMVGLGFIAAIIPFGPFLIDFKIAQMIRERQIES